MERRDKGLKMVSGENVGSFEESAQDISWHIEEDQGPEGSGPDEEPASLRMISMPAERAGSDTLSWISRHPVASVSSGMILGAFIGAAIARRM